MSCKVVGYIRCHFAWMLILMLGTGFLSLPSALWAESEFLGKVNGFTYFRLEKQFACQVGGEKPLLVRVKRNGQVKSVTRQKLALLSKKQRRRLNRKCKDLYAQHTTQSEKSPDQEQILYSLLGSSGQGVRLATVHGDGGTAGRDVAQATIPFSRSVSGFFTNSGGYGIVAKFADGTETVAQIESIAHHHGPSGASPAIARVLVPMQFSGEPESFELIARRAQALPSTTLFQYGQNAALFKDVGEVLVDVPGPGSFHWEARITNIAAQCELIESGPVRQTFYCGVPLSPKAGANQTQVGLSAHIHLSFDTGSSLIKSEVMISNSSTQGANHVPVERVSLQYLISGFALPVFAHNVQVPWVNESFYRHRVVGGDRFDLIPTLSSGLNAIRQDSFVNSTRIIIDTDGSLSHEATATANRTPYFLPEAETTDVLKTHRIELGTNWTETAPISLTRTPNLTEFETLSQIQSRIFQTHNPLFVETVDRTHHNGIASIHPDFYTRLAGYRNTGGAGGTGITYTPLVSNFLGSYRGNGHRMLIEGAIGYMNAFNDRSDMSFAIDALGRPMTPEQLVAQTTGAYHFGSEWRIHAHSQWNPNRDALNGTIGSDFQTLIDNQCPYKDIILNFNSQGSPDVNHTLRGIPPELICMKTGTYNCALMMKIKGRVYQFMRHDPLGVINFSNNYEALLRAAHFQASQGNYGTGLSRSLTANFYLIMGLLTEEHISAFQQSRVELFVEAMRAHFGQLSYFRHLRGYDPRDLEGQELLDFLTTLDSSALPNLDVPDWLLGSAYQTGTYLHCDAATTQSEEWKLNCARIGFMGGTNPSNREFMVHSRWMGNYASGIIGALGEHLKSYPPLQGAYRDIAHMMESHIHTANNRCETGVNMEHCALSSENGTYGWVHVVGTRVAGQEVVDLLPNPLILLHSRHNGSGHNYWNQMALSTLFAYETDAAEGYQTLVSVFPQEINRSAASAYGQYTSAGTAVLQGFPN